MRAIRPLQALLIAVAAIVMPGAPHRREFHDHRGPIDDRGEGAPRGASTRTEEAP